MSRQSLSSNTNLVVGVLMFLSLGTTILATALIIHRIHHLSQDIASVLDSYNFTMEIMIESGALYAAAQLVNCVLLTVHGTAFSAAPTWQGISFWIGIVTPIAVCSWSITHQPTSVDICDVLMRRELLQHS